MCKAIHIEKLSKGLWHEDRKSFVIRSKLKPIDKVRVEKLLAGDIKF